MPGVTCVEGLKQGDHIFFDCITARFTWACFKEALGWDRSPISLQDFFFLIIGFLWGV